MVQESFFFFGGGAILAISLFVSCSSKGFKKLALFGKAGQKQIIKCHDYRAANLSVDLRKM